jgi:hypothetical protein
LATLGNLLFGDRNPVPVDPPTHLVFQNTTRVRLDLVPLEVEVSEVQDHALVLPHHHGSWVASAAPRRLVGVGFGVAAWRGSGREATGSPRRALP